MSGSDFPAVTPPPHALDELRERRDTSAHVLRLEGKTDAGFDHAMRVGERTAVLEHEIEAMREDVREIKADQKDANKMLGQLTERGRFGRFVAVSRDLAAVFGLGGMGLWAVVELLKRAP